MKAALAAILRNQRRSQINSITKTVSQPSLSGRMEPVTNSDLKPTSKPRASGNPIIRVRTGRRLNRVVIAAEIMAVEGVEHIDQHSGGLLRSEGNVLLQSEIEVLISKYVTNPEECTSRGLIDVGLL